MQLLTEGNEATIERASITLKHLACGSTECRAAIVASGALEPLVLLLTKGNAANKRLALTTLKELASGSTGCKDAVVSAGALGP